MDRFSSDFFCIASCKDKNQVPLCVKILNHAGVKLCCINGSKGRDFEGVLPIISSKESKFILVEDVDSYSMVTLLGVHGNNINCVGLY